MQIKLRYEIRSTVSTTRNGNFNHKIVLRIKIRILIKRSTVDELVCRKNVYFEYEMKQFQKKNTDFIYRIHTIHQQTNKDNVCFWRAFHHFQLEVILKYFQKPLTISWMRCIKYKTEVHFNKKVNGENISTMWHHWNNIQKKKM